MQKMGAQAPAGLADDPWGEIEILDGPEEVDAHARFAPAASWGEIEILSEPESKSDNQTWVGKAWDAAKDIGGTAVGALSSPVKTGGAVIEALPRGAASYQKGMNLMDTAIAAGSLGAESDQVRFVASQIARKEYPYEGDEGQRRALEQSILERIGIEWDAGGDGSQTIGPYLQKYPDLLGSSSSGGLNPSALALPRRPLAGGPEETSKAVEQSLGRAAEHEADIQRMRKETAAERPAAYEVMTPREQRANYPEIWMGDMLGENVPAMAPGVIGTIASVVTKNPLPAVAGAAAYAPATTNELYDAIGQWEKENKVSLPEEDKAQAVLLMLVPHMGVEQLSNLVAVGLGEKAVAPLAGKIAGVQLGKKAVNSFMGRFLSKVGGSVPGKIARRVGEAAITGAAEELTQDTLGQAGVRIASGDKSVKVAPPDPYETAVGGALLESVMGIPGASFSAGRESIQDRRGAEQTAEPQRRGLVDEDAVRESQREQFGAILDMEEQLRARGVDMQQSDRAGWRALAMYANDNGLDEAVRVYQGLKAGGEAVSKEDAAELDALRKEFGSAEADEVEAVVQRQRRQQAATNPIEDLVRRTAQSMGFDEATALAMADIESNVGRAENRPGSQYLGVFQMGEDAARDVGINPATRDDPGVNIRAGIAYARINEERLRAQGIDLSAMSPEERAAMLYLAHNQGSGGAAEIYRAAIGQGEVSDETRRNMLNQSRELASDDPAQFMENVRQAMGSRMTRFSGGSPGVAATFNDVQDSWQPAPRNAEEVGALRREADTLHNRPDAASRRRYLQVQERLAQLEQQPGISESFAAREQAGQEQAAQDRRAPFMEVDEASRQREREQQAQDLRRRSDEELKARAERQRARGQEAAAERTEGMGSPAIRLTLDDVAGMGRSELLDTARGIGLRSPERMPNVKLRREVRKVVAERSRDGVFELMRRVDEDTARMGRNRALPAGQGFELLDREQTTAYQEGRQILTDRVAADREALKLPQGQGFEALIEAPQRVDSMKRADLLAMGQQLDLGLSARDSNQVMRRAIKAELQRQQTSLGGSFVGEADQAPGVSVEGNDSGGTTHAGPTHTRTDVGADEGLNVSIASKEERGNVEREKFESPLGPFRSRYKNGDAVGRISDESAAEINSLGFDTAPSDVTVTDRDIDYIEGRHGDQLDDDDVANLTRVIADPTEILPNISTDQSPQRDRSVLFVRKNGKSYVSIVEVSVGDGDNRLWNYWKMRPEKAEKYLAKFRDEKTRRQQPGGATSSSSSSLPGAPGVGKPEGLSGSQATDAGEKNITPESDSDKGGTAFKRAGRKENSRVPEGQVRPTIGRGAQAAAESTSPAQDESGGLQLPKESPDVQGEENVRTKAEMVNKRLSTPAQARMVDETVSAANEHLGGSTVVALHHPDDIPPHIRRMMSYNDMGTAGFYQDGKAYVMGWNAQSETDVADTVAHELTHAGLDRARIENAARKARGEKAQRIREALADVDATLDDIYRSHKADIDRLVAAGAPYEGDFDMRTLKGRRGVTEEWLAAHPLRGEHAWYDRYVAALRRLLRALGEAMGMDLNYSDIEIRNLLWQSGEQMRARHVAMKTGMPVPPVPAFQRTWHGSAKNDTERFALEYIGTGAGGRVFGWGFYLTGDRGLADRYRQLALGKQGAPETGGAVYEVDIPDNHRLLDWDKPITKQPHFVQYAFRAAHKQGMFTGKYADMSKLTGGDGYYRVKDWLYMTGQVPEGKSADQAASEWFAREGVHGNRHRNDYGSTSFVVWKEDALDILNRHVGGKKLKFKRRGKDVEDNPITAPAVGALDRAPTLGEIERYAKETGDKDMGTTRELLGSLQWLAKDNPGLVGFFEATRRRTQKRQQGFRHSTEPVADLLKGLNEKQRKDLVDVVWEIEGKPLKGQTERAFNEVKEGDETYYEVNDGHFKQLRDILVKHGVDPKVAEAVAAMRKSFDQSLALTWRAFASKAPKNQVAKLRQSFGRVHNYFPRMRFGDYFIRATDPETGEVVYREHFDAALFKTKKGRKLLEERKKAHPEWNWEAPKQVQGLPEEVYDSPVQTEAVAQIIRAAAQKTLGQDNEKYHDFERALMESAADVFKSRGHGSRMIRRSDRDIGGYEKANIERVFYSYHSGFNGWLTKMEAAMEYQAALNEIDAQKTPRVYAWAKRFTRDLLENNTKFDRSMDKVKSWIFFKYLAGAISTAAVNMTQNYVLGLPRLGMEVGTINATNNLFGGSAAAIRKMITNQKGTHLSADELSMLKDLHERGELDSQFMNEVLGSTRSRAGKLVGTVLKVGGWPMEVTEKFNRSSMALSAYRAARKGKIKRAETLKKFGYKLGQKWNHEDAMKFADEITIDTNFWMDKGNRPQIARGGKAGKLVNVFMTFRTFMLNTLQCWRWMAKQGGAGRLALAQSLAVSGLLGGLPSALPFIYGPLVAAIRGLLGYDPEDLAYEAFGPTGGRIVTNGVFAPLGVTIGTSLRMDLPVLSRLKADESFTQKAGRDILWSIIGASGSALLDVVDSGLSLIHGDFSEAAKKAAPRSIANVIRAHEGFTEGKTTRSGKGINRFGKAEPRKYSPGEAVLKGLSFQTTEDVVSRDEYQGRQQVAAWRDEKADRYAKMYLEGYREGNVDKMRKAMGKWRNHNAKYKDEPHKMIKSSPKDRAKRLLKGDMGPRLERSWAKTRDSLRYGVEGVEEQR
ncbi:PLxRFG domain-containing protein [Oceanidesulfovibrio marinus]|uniref:Uncharacterized protein n=1 Tax=Oceanidesulfovibrio marinus TaxID=370038 RepID=A0A6P1ZBY9_9BACT|nr:PLxRFG domain-containing protein [Oceanidesulfovibrio marinus]TVM30255.1 hypothetical protein DQK91_21370 [Oceanidesulfovibrio marinus]